MRILLSVAAFLAVGVFALADRAADTATQARPGAGAPAAASAVLTFEEAAAKFGEELAAALNEHQADRVFALFDRGAFADRTLRALPDESYGLRLRVFDEVRSSLSPMFSEAKHTRFLRLKPVGKEICALVRLVTPDQGVVYLGFVVRPDEAGALRWCDVHIYGQGEMFSEIVRWPIAQMAAERDQGIWAAFFGRNQPFTDCVPGIRQARELLDAGSAAKAWAIVEAFPEEVRSQRMLLRLQLRIAGKLSTDRQLAVLAEWERKYPGDLAPVLLGLDVDFERKDFSRFPQRLALLQQLVGGDPYLDLINAVVLLECEKFEEARGAARAVLAQASAPADKAAAFDFLLQVEIATKDYAAVANVLDEMEAAFPGVDPEAVPSAVAYAGFRSSPAYADWKARRAARTVPTEAECAAFGTEIAERLKLGDIAAVNARLDQSALIDRALRGLRLDPSLVSSIKTVLAAEYQRAAPVEFPTRGKIRFLRTQEVDGERRLLLRLVSEDEHFAYMALTCSRRSDGTVGWCDAYDLMPRAFASARVRRVLLATLAKNEPAVRAQLTGIDRVVFEAEPRVAALAQLRREHRFPEALRLLQSLPEELREYPTIMGIMVDVAGDAGMYELEALCEDWALQHPGDPTLAPVQLELAMLRADYFEAIRQIDTLQEIVGEDPYLDLRRAQACWLDKDFDAAREAARRAIAREPELRPAYEVLWRTETANGDFAAAGRVLADFEARFAADGRKEPITSDPALQRFLLSAKHPNLLNR